MDEKRRQDIRDFAVASKLMVEFARTVPEHDCETVLVQSLALGQRVVAAEISREDAQKELVQFVARCPGRPADRGYDDRRACGLKDILAEETRCF